MIICIPTHMRETAKEQSSIRFLPKERLKKTYLFTDENRVNLLRQAVPSECTIVPVPSELASGGIAAKRQFIVEWSHNNGFDKIWMIDDSLDFCKNTGLHPTLQKGPQLLRFKDPEEMEPFIQSLEDKLDQYPFLGHLNRSGTYQTRIKSEDVYEDFENSRLYSSLGMRTSYLIQNEIRFDFLQKKYQDQTLSLMEDYAVQLQILTRGDKTLQIGNFCFDKKSFSDSKSGCALERNKERQMKVVQALVDSFPEHCKMVEAKDENKKEKVGVNIRISWSNFKLKESKESKSKVNFSNSLEDF